jgi:hypothetical protein
MRNRADRRVREVARRDGRVICTTEVDGKAQTLPTAEVIFNSAVRVDAVSGRRTAPRFLMLSGGTCFRA